MGVAGVQDKEEFRSLLSAVDVAIPSACGRLLNEPNTPAKYVGRAMLMMMMSDPEGSLSTEWGAVSGGHGWCSPVALPGLARPCTVTQETQ